jgi:hypothetical protein
MDAPRLTRPYLESLTTDELVRMADRVGIDIPPSLERVFISGELLDIAAAEEAGTGEDDDAIHESTDFFDSAPLPKQYNITFIEALIRDPLWVFVFWELKGSDKELYEKEENFEGYCLRVIPGKGAGEPQREDSFTVPVGIDDSAWYLGFSPVAGGAAAVGGVDAVNTRFQVELCVLLGSETVALAVSRLFTMPKLLSPAAALSPGLSPLALLSGAEDFRVIRNADRHIRARHGAGKSGESSV